jgi:membrane associated rhomboid family serine protease
MAYISFLFARFDIGTGPSSPSVMLTAAFFGAITGLALAAMFANRVKRKALLR